MFKLGLDIHGVIDKDPGMFIDYAGYVKYNGGEVHIITGAPFRVAEQQLLDLGSGRRWWTHFFSVQEYMTQEGFRQVLDGDNYPHFAPSDWNRMKADYCRRENISLHIDDQLEYLEFFTTPCMWYSSNPQSQNTNKYKPLFKED